MTMNEFAVKNFVRARDGYKCVDCGMTADEHKRNTGRTLDVHRMTQGSKYTVDDCVTLCRSCHAKKPTSPRPTQTWQRFSVHFSDEQHAGLMEIRASSGLMFSELIRRAVDAYLKAENQSGGKGR
jgi:hypothetical protein